MFSELIRVTDAGVARMRDRLGRIVTGRAWQQEQSVIETKGWVRTLCRERGKIVPGSRREQGFNTWTNTGREFNAMSQTLKPDQTRYRSDTIAYLGVGTGLQTEDPSVVGLVQPIPYVANTFLAAIDHSATDFPLSPTRTTVRYVRVYTEDQLTFGDTTAVSISEFGLFTNGDPQNGFATSPGRSVTMAVASQQAPNAYKALLEPVEKTNVLEFQVEWEIRY
jgi:hypothetical protein